jgi:hypothetical protein
MFGLWTVARFARHSGMLTGLLLIENVDMTSFANAVTGMNDREGRNFLDRVPPVMSELTEGWRHQERAKSEKSEHR